MPDKQQIIKTSLFASCETYNCQHKVAWAIGRPDGPRQLWDYYCDQCMRDIVASIPAELMPEPDKTYICKYCGESFDTPPKLAGHTRNCKAKKEAING